MCSPRESFVTFTELQGLISVGDKESASPLWCSSVKLADIVRSDKKRILLKDVLYVVDVMFNLISLSRARRNCFAINFDSNFDGARARIINMTLKHSIMISMLGFETEDELFEAVLSASYGETCVAVGRRFKDWHSRMGHCRDAVLKNTFPHTDGNRKNNVKPKNVLRRDCALGMTTAIFRSSRDDRRNRPPQPVDFVCTDVVGLMKFESSRIWKYFVALKNEYSCFYLVRFTSQKSKAGKATMEMIGEVQKLFHTRTKTL